MDTAAGTILTARKVPSGLYAIIDTGITAENELLSRAAAVIAGGATTLQYRDKSADPEKRLDQATALAELCRRRKTIFIVNDDYKLAAAAGADGVHLGEEDDQLAAARDTLGAGAVIGISCYNQVETAINAEQEGADYVAFGRCFPSVTKPGERYITLDQIRVARQRVNLPIVGIGGISPTNVRQLTAAGVDAVAVIAALFSVADSESAAREICGQMHHR